jgi:G3E family GTPase
VRERAKLDSIVTVVDAKNFLQRLEDSHEAAEQVAFADIVLLNKVDLVSPEELATVAARIRSMNPMATIHHTDHCSLPVDELLDRGAFDLDRILAIEPNFLGEDDHVHDQSITSVCVTAERPLDINRFRRWVSELLRIRGVDILRSKGILDIKGSPERYVFQAVHMLMEANDGKRWEVGERRESKFVMIGRNLEEDELRAEFAACAAD